MHRRKIVKYTLRTLLGLVAALVPIPASLYIPAVQDFVRIRAERLPSPVGRHGTFVAASGSLFRSACRRTTCC